jgi:glycosyltransferase involved in cell wall biosynthesis
MTEMLDNGKAGHLVSPQKPEQIAAAVIALVDDPKRRMEMGELARERVLNEYNLERIGSLQEASDERAIARRRVIGSRPTPSLSLL